MTGQIVDENNWTGTVKLRFGDTRSKGTIRCNGQFSLSLAETVSLSLNSTSLIRAPVKADNTFFKSRQQILIGNVNNTDTAYQLCAVKDLFGTQHIDVHNAN